MSSIYVRDQVINFLESNSDEDFIELIANFEEIKELLAENEIQSEAPWVGLDFQGDSEEPISLSATNDQGLYRERGIIQVHVAAAAQIGSGRAILTRGEVLQNLLRGRRMGDVVIRNVEPMVFGTGATLDFDGGYMSGSFIVYYYRDLTLEPD